ncbi:MAG: DUF4269 domain-containing protein [Chloroflexi bacterium]|nr:MAG: DUF4269 domain-containing protein [Chloroflexota bacterium]
MTDYRDLAYLLDGSAQQRRAFHALQWLNVFGILDEYDPVLVGTIPINLDIPGSDLDIICEAHDLSAFADCVRAAFSKHDGFNLRTDAIAGMPTVVARFTYRKFPVEIFGQPRPVEQQHAYRHMLIEARLLALGGEKMRRALRELKRQGVKTEPAFAQYLLLEGDPYLALLELEAFDDDALREFLLVKDAERKAAKKRPPPR